MAAGNRIGIFHRIGGLVTRKLQLVLALFALATLAVAAPVPVGKLNFDGAGSNALVRVGADYIDFYPEGGTTGLIEISQATGIFGGLAGENATITDLNLATATPGTMININPFISTSLFDLSLTFIGKPSAALPTCTVGSVACVPRNEQPDSPFVLLQSGNNVSVTMNVEGFVIDGALYPYEGVFTTQISGTTIPALLAAFGPDGIGYIESTYSAELTAYTPIPEPGTVALFGVGLGLIAVSRLRRKA